MGDMDLLYARWQMGLSLAFHIVFAVIGKRTVYPTVPAKVEYELTDVGRSLIKPLSALSAWVQKNQPAIEAARASRKSVE